MTKDIIRNKKYIPFLLIYFFFVLSWANATEELFPHVEQLLTDYTKKERNLIKQDWKNIRDLSFRNICVQPQKIYVATAGGAASSKTSIIETCVHKNKGKFVYISSIQRILKLMINTYLQDINHYAMTQGPYMSVMKKACHKWKKGAHYITQKIFNEAVQKGFSIAKDSSSTNASTEPLFKKLKTKAYKIVLFLCLSSEENYKKAIKHRQDIKNFYQVTPENFEDKIKQFFKMFPIYFRHADELQFFWIEDFSKGWKRAAAFTQGNFYILDKIQFKKFETLHEAFRKIEKASGKNDPLSLDALIKQTKSKNP